MGVDGGACCQDARMEVPMKLRGVVPVYPLLVDFAKWCLEYEMESFYALRFHRTCRTLRLYIHMESSQQIIRPSSQKTEYEYTGTV